MRVSRVRRRKEFLEKMSKEAIASYDDTYKEWYDDEKEYLPIFMSHLGSGRYILDLAGGYAKAPPQLIGNDNSVVLADLSLTSLKNGRAEQSGNVEFVLMDMLVEMPFVDGAFDGIWFTEAFEYVPPDQRVRFLRSLRRIVKEGGVVYLTAEGLSKGQTRLSYLKNYLYWKVVKRAPVVWGEYIYMLDLPKYKGWHYHALVLSMRIEKSFLSAGFEVEKLKRFGKSEYASFLLRAV